MPFTLTTVELGGGHLQAVIGYDRLRRSLLIRDPTFPNVAEADVDRLVERYAVWGPRGMALVPADEANRLDGLDLPDSGLYDAYHALNKALLAHDRPAIEAALGRLLPAGGGHAEARPLALLGEAAVAAYDADVPRELAAVAAVLQRHDGCDPLHARRLGLLDEAGRWDEARAELERLAADPERDAQFTERLAERLADDARAAPRVRRLLRGQLRRRGALASPYRLLGPAALAGGGGRGRGGWGWTGATGVVGWRPTRTGSPR